jgi:hypothetical protein
MTRHGRHIGLAVAVLAALAATGSAGAQPSGALSPSAYSPRVPISAFALPASWLDPSRLHVSTTVSVGSGFAGGSEALQVTRFSYRFGAPLSMQVNLGNAWGQGTGRGQGAFFLEGLNLAYRPSPSMYFQIQYRSVRSPLQLSTYPGDVWMP